MKVPGFYLYGRKGQLVVTGGNLQLAPRRTADSSPVHLQGQVLTICLTHQDTPESVESSLWKALKGPMAPRYLMYLLTVGMRPLVSLLLAAIVVLLLGVMGVFGDVVYDLLTIASGPDILLPPFSYTEYGAWLLAGTAMVLLTLLLYFLPSMFQGEYQDVKQALLSRLSDQNAREQRLARAFAFLKGGRHQVHTIVIWNPSIGGPDEGWRWQYLLNAAVGSLLKLQLHVLTEERQVIVRYLARKDISVSEEGGKRCDLPEQTGCAISPHYLALGEQTLLTVMQHLSFPSAAYDLRARGVSSVCDPQSQVVSLPLLSKALNAVVGQLIELGSSAPVNIESFLRRCESDYQLLVTVAYGVHDVVFLQPVPDLPEDSRMVAIAEDYCRSHATALVNRHDQPVANLILEGLCEDGDVYTPNRVLIVEAFIESVYRAEQYFLLKECWDRISCNGSTPESTALTCGDQSDLYALLDEQALWQLATSLERAGRYRDADQVYGYICELRPFAAALARARLWERNDEFDRALDALDEIARRWVLCDDPDPQQVLRYHLAVAWVVVSARRSDHQHRGEQSLQHAGDYLDALSDRRENRKQLWQRHNIEAQYAEWNEQYPEALKSYQVCTRIPGLGQGELSGTLCNVGLTYRMMVVHNSPVDTSEQATSDIDQTRLDQSRLEQAIQVGGRSVRIKTQIGDEDDLTVALHNLAWSHLELARVNEAYQAEDEANARLCLSYCDQGLALLDRKKSHRKQGQLLAESFLARYRLARIALPATESKNKQVTICGEALLAWLKPLGDQHASDNFDLEHICLMFRSYAETAPETAAEVVGLAQQLTGANA